MGIKLVLILSHSMDAADLVAFPERVRSSVLMRRAAEHLWQAIRPRWENLAPVDEFLTVLATEHFSVSDVITAWKRKEDVPSFRWALEKTGAPKADAADGRVEVGASSKRRRTARG